jgi:transposase
LGYSRGGFGTKLHLIVDGRGIPLAIDLTAGQTHDSMRCEPLIQQTLDQHPDVLPMQVTGDKGYSYDRIRRFLQEHDIEAVIPRRKNQPAVDPDVFDRATYRRRSAVECCIGWLKESRALATRFEKLAVNFLATVHLAIIRRYLRLLDPSDSA